MSARYCVIQSVLCAFYGDWLSALSGSLSHFWHLKRLPSDGGYAWGVTATLYLSVKLCAGVLLVCLSFCLSLSVCPYVCLSVCLSLALSLSLSLFLSVDTQSSTWTNHSHMRTILYLGRKAFSCAFVKSEKHRKYLWTFTYCYYTYFIHQRRLIYELHLGRNRFAWPKRML